MAKRTPNWSWLWLALGLIYFAVPLLATFLFSIKSNQGLDKINLDAYDSVLHAPDFVAAFLFSFKTAFFTIVISSLLLVPTAYWVHLRLPRFRLVLEFLTLLPFVIPPIVLAFSLIRAYNSTSLTNTSEGVYVIMLGAYVMLSFPYMYRSIDTGLTTINVRTLTEAGQSLGASWFTILFRIIFPNIAGALLNGAFITFSIVMGEFTIASVLLQPTLGPYMATLGNHAVYEPSALAILSFLLTWASILLIQRIGRGAPIAVR